MAFFTKKKTEPLRNGFARGARSVPRVSLASLALAATLFTSPVGLLRMLSLRVADREGTVLLLPQPSLSNHTAHLKRFELGPHALIADEQEGTPESIAKTVVNYVRKNGRLKTLVIDAHGLPGMLILKKETFTPVEAVLSTLLLAQTAYGKPLAERIEFHSCELFANASPRILRTCLTMAKALGAEIVGATTIVLSWGPFTSGRFIAIRPDGRIEQDGITGPSVTSEVLSAIHGLSSDWRAAAEGQTVDEGASPTPSLPARRTLGYFRSAPENP